MTPAGVPEGGDDREVALGAIRSARRVLVVRADDLGDHVLAGAFPAALAASTDAECGLVGSPAALELLDTAPLSFVAGVDCRPRCYRDPFRDGRHLRREIDRFDPDVVLLPRYGFEREALGVALLGLRRRTVITWERHATAKRARRSWWLSALPGPRLAAADAPLHELDRLRAFASFVGADPSALAPRLSPDLYDRSLPLPELTVETPFVAVGIGAAQARRWWPLDRFAAVVRRLGELGYTSVLVGSSDEVGRGQEVRGYLGAATPVLDLIGRLPLRDTARLLGRSALYVGNDSGIGHIAAAMGVPTVTISCHPAGASPHHVNAPERYHPVSHGGVVVRPASPATAQCADGCVPSDRPCCITNVPVADVAEAGLALLVGDGAAVVRDDPAR